MARIPLGWAPTLLASGYGYLWIASRKEHTVARLDPKTSQLIGAPVRLSEPIYEIVAGEGGVWVSGDTTVTRLDPENGQVAASVRGDQFGDGTPFRMAEGNGLVWVVNLQEAAWGSHVYRISPQTNRYVGEPATVGVEALSITFGAGSLWSADHDASTVSRVDPKTNQRIATISATSEPHYVFFSPEDGHVWVANYHINAVTRIDPRTNQVVGQPLRLPFAPEWITSGNGKVWVLPSPSFEGRPQGVKSIAEFDVNRLDEPKIVPLEGVPMDAEWTVDALWLTLQAPNIIVKLSP
jgi:YVTN family beta-propeller protein